MKREHIGTVEAVSTKNAGLKLGDEWYNAAEDARDSVASTLKGKRVSLSLREGKTFDAVTVLEGPVTTSEPIGATKEARIVRMSALNHADALLTAKAGALSEDDYFGYAARVESWINRGE